MTTSEILWGTFKEHVLILLLPYSSAHRIWQCKKWEFGAGKTRIILHLTLQSGKIRCYTPRNFQCGICSVEFVRSYTKVTCRQQCVRCTLDLRVGITYLYFNLLNFLRKLYFFLPKYTFPFKGRFGLGDTAYHMYTISQHPRGAKEGVKLTATFGTTGLGNSCLPEFGLLPHFTHWPAWK